MRHRLSCLLFVALAACGTVLPSADDARVDDAAGPIVDAAPIDAAVPVDAAIDASPPPPGQELTGGAGRVRSTTYTMDVQLGHPLGQQPIQSTSYRLQANTPIKP